jgi:hypothetical protein
VQASKVNASPNYGHVRLPDEGHQALIHADPEYQPKKGFELYELPLPPQYYELG